MEWTFPWSSSFRNDFEDFHVTLDEKNAEYNYHHSAALKATGKIWIDRGELPTLSVFLRDSNNILHTYSTYQLGLNLLLNTYNYLDLTPLGRNEQRPME